MRHVFTTVVTTATIVLAAPSAFGQNGFVNWETPHVHPLDLTPDGAKLLAVNTADNRLEVFTVTPSGLQPAGSVPVGLDPVSVRARTNTEAWVVNHISDSVSIVNLATLNVVSTLFVGDEPADVVFAGNPQRAFVSVSQLNQVKVYNPANLAAAPTVLAIAGEDPRALATDGDTVYAAIFESGNLTTVIGEAVVASAVNPYIGDPNPPPNDGSGFDPPMAGGLPPGPDSSLIVKKDSGGAWRDVNGADWSAAVTWDLHDHDVAIIDAGTLAVTYATGVMNLNMAMSPRPGGGVTVIGTEAINEVRFEPNVNGVFVRVMAATVAGPGAPSALVDLNPHLDYSAPMVDQKVRDLSLGDPRGVAWTSDGSRAYIAGMGSNNLVVVDAALNRLAEVEVGQGPTGVVVDDAHDRVYVLDKFEGALSIVGATSLVEEARHLLHDATPAVIKIGRPHLYDTHETSGLGQAACASCHVDGRMDQVSWDLGDPSGAVKPFNQECNFGLGGCENWHPMKGPMATQTLIGIGGTEPFHWRGDREGLAAFNPAFESLMGDDEQLTPQEMNEYLAFVQTLTHPPNPFRNLDNSLPASFPNGGNPVTGQSVFNTVPLDGGLLTCVTCHSLPAGTNGKIISGNLLQEAQSFKVPQLRNLYEKTGFSSIASSNNRGFGFIHDGSVDTLFEFLQFPGFNFSSDTQRRDVEAFLFCFSTHTHAGIGAQAMLPNPGTPNQPATVSQLVALAGNAAVGLVVKGKVGGLQRGYYLNSGGNFQSDRAAEVVSLAVLTSGAAPGSELAFTLVPAIAEVRIGVDRDRDAFFDRDELDAGSDPADPISTPNNVGDVDGDGSVGITDLLALLAAWGPCPVPPAGCPADIDGDGIVGITDLLSLLGHWG